LALLLFLITTVTPSVEGSTFRSSPETPFYEYAQSGQKEADNQELGTANAPSTEQILLISSAIALTIWHLTRTRDDVPRVELSSETHSISEDEELEHYYSNGATRPAIPHRDTFQRHETFLLGLRDSEKSPPSNDDDLSEGSNTSNGDDTDDGVTYEEITYAYTLFPGAPEVRIDIPDQRAFRSGLVADRVHQIVTGEMNHNWSNRMRKPT
jgi:hypothetical protein